ncbi:MAG: TRAP transporter substrate-binding protein DctP [Cyclobacteriaceae bacterium]|nr:TRAP transporter substrate-binding protein DctP [Cyclobacteriaceae bacterium]
MSIDRRNFIKKSAATAITAGLAGSCALPEEKSAVETPYINFNNTYEWKITTTWPPNFPVTGEGCNYFAQWIEEMSGGRMKIRVYGGGELVPPLESFEAVSNGAIEMGHGAAYYWAGKAPASQFFAAVPFGMNYQQMNAWIVAGGGRQLWEELYDRFDLMPMICGNTGVQMGGWYNKEINSIDDLKGLKMRMPGLGGKVLARAGGTALLVAGGEIYTNLERGVIDATEWIGPYHDYKMGFHRVAKYYYYPGWHEPGPVLELIVNKSKFLKLPSDLQTIIRTAALRSNVWMGAEFDAQNFIYLDKIMEEGNVDIRPFPIEVLEKLRQYTDEVIQELVEQDADSKKVYQAYNAFRNGLNRWSAISEKEFYQKLMG